MRYKYAMLCLLLTIGICAMEEERADTPCSYNDLPAEIDCIIASHLPQTMPIPPEKASFDVGVSNRCKCFVMWSFNGQHFVTTKNGGNGFDGTDGAPLIIEQITEDGHVHGYHKEEHCKHIVNWGPNITHVIRGGIPIPDDEIRIRSLAPYLLAHHRLPYLNLSQYLLLKQMREALYEPVPILL